MDRLGLARTDQLLPFAERCDRRSGFMYEMRITGITGHDTLAFNSMCKMNIFLTWSAFSQIVLLQIWIKYKIGHNFDSICALQGLSSTTKSHNVMNQ
jgi:hypothetical protein